MVFFVQLFLAPFPRLLIEVQSLGNLDFACSEQANIVLIVDGLVKNERFNPEPGFYPPYATVAQTPKLQYANLKPSLSSRALAAAHMYMGLSGTVLEISLALDGPGRIDLTIAEAV